MSALKFIQIIARKKAAQKGGEGITSIANRMQAEAKAGEIAATFRASGLTPDKWDDFIKSEKDVIKYLNIIESTEKQAIEEATKKSSKDILKVTKKKEEPFTGWTPKVATRSMAADDYKELKKEWFGRIIANTDDDINTFLKKGINQTDERFVTLSKDQRKDFLDMVEYRLKHGNKKFMNDSEMFFKKQNGIDWKKVEETDLDEFADGGLAPLLGEPTYADGGRARFGFGRRAFLKLMGGAAAGTAAAKSGLLSIFKGGGKKQIVETLTQVPIGSAPGMPPWFKLAVNKVIAQGDDVTKKFATQEREIVHQVSIEGKVGKEALGVEDVRVTQNLDEGTIRLQYNSPDTIGESGVELVYKKGEWIEPTISKTGKVTKGTKTKPEFTAVEDDFYPQQTSPDGDFDLEFTENIVKNVDDLYSDTSKLKQFATGKKLTIKEISEATKKKNILKEIDKNPNEHAFRNAPDYDDSIPDDFASGGRVPLAGGGGKKLLDLGIAALRKKFGKDIIKKGSDLKRPKSALEREMFQNFNKKIQMREMIEKKYKGVIDDKLLNQILIDDNPQRIAEVMATIDEALLMQGKGMGPETIMTTLRDSWKRKKNATGGRVPLFWGGTAGKKLWQEFIEKLFLKSSNEIRLNKKGLTQGQWIKKHDDLTKILKEWEMGGKKSLPKNIKEFFGMNEIQLANKFKIETGQIQASRPTKTLEGIEKTGTIDISNPGIADEFSRFMKETDPKGFKELEQKVELSNLDIKGKKGHAEGGRVSLSAGGLAGMLGE